MSISSLVTGDFIFPPAFSLKEMILPEMPGYLLALVLREEAFSNSHTEMLFSQKATNSVSSQVSGFTCVTEGQKC